MTSSLIKTFPNAGGLIKSVGDNSFEGYLVRFTSPDERDLQDEWFSAKTHFMLRAGYPVKGAPINYQHGMEPEFGNLPVGVFSFVDEDEIGLFVRGQLHIKEQYEEMLKELGRVKGIALTRSQLGHKSELAMKAVQQLIQSIPLQQSMGADVAAYKVNPETGHIDQCGIVHGALTPTPADEKNPMVKFKSIWKDVLSLDSESTIHGPGSLGAGQSNAVNREGVNPTSDLSESPTKQDTQLKTPKQENNPMGKKMDALLKALSPEEADLFRNELMSAIDGVINGMGMEADDAMMAEMADEMEGNLAELPDDVVGEAASAAAADIVAEADVAPLTEEVVAEIVASNLEEILPEAIKQHLGKRKALANRRQSSVDNIVKGAPAKSRKSERGGFRQGEGINKQWGIVGRADKPTLQSVLKGILNHTYKAQNPYIGTMGGYLVGQEIADQILEPLRASVVMFDMGVKSTTVNNIGVYTVPKMTTAPSAYRPGINTAISDDEGLYDTITAYLRPIAAQVIVPRQLLMTAQPNFEQQLKDQMVKSIRLQIDKEILVGTGSVVSDTGAEIKGILQTLTTNTALASSNISTLATNGRKPLYTDMVAAETQISTGNVEMDDATSGWVMHPRTRGTFRSLVTTTGEPLLFDNYGQKPYQEIIGYKIATTTQVPITVTTGTSTTSSYIFAGNYAYSEYVMANDIEVIVDEMTLADKLQVRIIAYTYSDFIVHYPEAFYVMKGVTS